MSILSYQAKFPKIADTAFIADNATVIGDVEIGAEASIWFGTVLRGDVHFIRVGARTNIQDNSVVHVTTARNPTIVGEDVTVGHAVVLHGCTVKDRALIGMGAIVMDRAVVGEGAIVAAGALVPEGMEIPDGMVAFGSPAKVRRPVREAEERMLARSAPHYVEVARNYRAASDSEPT